MSIAEPLASAEDQSLESEMGETFPNLHALALPFGEPRVAMANRRSRISAICCAGYQNPR